jgi:hypothetical protein
MTGCGATTPGRILADGVILETTVVLEKYFGLIHHGEMADVFAEMALGRGRVGAGTKISSRFLLRYSFFDRIGVQSAKTARQINVKNLNFSANDIHLARLAGGINY